MISFPDKNTALIDNIQFDFIQEINPKLDEEEDIKQLRHKNHENRKLNTYGEGPFCRFSIGENKKDRGGVYALICNRKPLYIGACGDLKRQFNTGYGNITFINRCENGQSTNCKINSRIYEHHLRGEKVALYFYETDDDREQIKKRLIGLLRPPYNE